MHLYFAAVVLTVAVAGCRLVGGGPGTGGYSVTVVNDLAETVTFHAAGVGENADSAVTHGVKLAAGASYVDHWMTPNATSGDKRALVRATNAAGQLVFCQQVSWPELDRANLRIHIVEVLSC